MVPFELATGKAAMKISSTFALVLLFFATDSAASDLNRISCEITNDSVIVDFGITKHPTFFGIETPKKEFIYIRYPPRNVDVLGRNYLGTPVRLDIADLQGFIIQDDVSVPKKVFDGPGEYVLRFQDANTIANADLHKLSCRVLINSKHVPTGSDTGKSADNFAGIYEPDEPLVIKVDTSMVELTPGCNYYPNCGGGGAYCCVSGPDPTFCTCSNCCVGRPPYVGSMSIMAKACTEIAMRP